MTTEQEDDHYMHVTYHSGRPGTHQAVLFDQATGEQGGFDQFTKAELWNLASLLDSIAQDARRAAMKLDPDGGAGFPRF